VKFVQAFSALAISGFIISRTLAAPTADEIIAKVKERSAEASTEKNSFTYRRVSRVDYLDERGEIKRNSTRVYEVAPVDGQPVSRLVEINGRATSQKHEPTRSAARETGEKSRNLSLGDDLLGRFEYKLAGEELIADRKVWTLEFRPKADPPENSFLDKLVNAMHGTMWVDQQEYEISKIDVHLGKRVSFFGGLAGAIDKLDLHMIQKRLNSQAWLTEALTLDFTGRKLFTPIRFRCFENSSGFRKVSPLAEK
jgi:hypothetical protein